MPAKSRAHMAVDHLRHMAARLSAAGSVISGLRSLQDAQGF